MDFLGKFFGNKLNDESDLTIEQLINEPEKELQTNVVLQSLLKNETNLLKSDAKSPTNENKICSDKNPVGESDGTIEQMDALESKNVIISHPMENHVSCSETQDEITESMRKPRPETRIEINDKLSKRRGKRKRFRTYG